MRKIPFQWYSFHNKINVAWNNFNVNTFRINSSNSNDTNRKYTPLLWLRNLQGYSFSVPLITAMRTIDLHDCHVSCTDIFLIKGLGRIQNSCAPNWRGIQFNPTIQRCIFSTFHIHFSADFRHNLRARERGVLCCLSISWSP